MKICPKCKIEKPFSEYSPGNQPDGLRWECKTCANARNRKNFNSKKEASRKRYQRYKIEVLKYDEFYEKQKGCCALCGKHASEVKRGLHVDHCHTTGRLRGLLCLHCNTSLGKLGDSVEAMEKVIEYLKI